MPLLGMFLFAHTSTRPPFLWHFMAMFSVSSHYSLVSTWICDLIIPDVHVTNFKIAHP